MKINLFFTFSRVCATTARTLLLFFIIYVQKNKNESSQLALLLTIGLSLFQLFNCDAHRGYYKQYFDTKKHSIKTANSYIIYLNFFTGISIISIIPLMVILFFLFDSIIVIAFYPFVILFEKFFDEYQRFNLYIKHYIFWSYLALIVYLIPVLLTLFLIIFFDLNVVNCFVSCSFLVYFCLSLYLKKKIPWKIWKIWKMISHSLRFYASRFGYLVINYLSSHILIVSRYMIYLTHESFFSLYVLIMNISNIVPTIIDLFYTAYRRKYFLTKKNEPFKILTDKKFFGLISISIICSGAVISYLVIDNGHQILDSIKISMIICFIGLLYSISLILYESVFWQRNIYARFTIEVVYYSFIIIIFSYSYFFKIELLFILCLLSLAMLNRNAVTYYYIRGKK